MSPVFYVSDDRFYAPQEYGRLLVDEQVMAQSDYFKGIDLLDGK